MLEICSPNPMTKKTLIDRLSTYQGAAVLFSSLRARPIDDSLDDASLVKACLNGDNRAYEVLLRRYQKLVYNVLFQMVHSHEMAADLTQDTFLKAYRALKTFRVEGKFKPWLLRIATNTCLNAIRDNKEHDSLDDILEENPGAEPAYDEKIEEMVEWRLTHKKLEDALKQLPVRHRQVFILRYQHDLPYEEIAEVSGESVSTIKSLLFRIREKLRKMLAESVESGILS